MRKFLQVVAMMAIMVLGLVVTPNVALAATNVCDDPNIGEDLKAAAGCVDASGFDRDTTFMPAAIKIVEVVIAVSGVLAAGILVYGGLTYVLSVGSPDKVKRAQNIVIYAVIGMVVSAFAFTIVYFVSRSIWGEAEQAMVLDMTTDIA